MATPLDVAERPGAGGTQTTRNLVEMNWDPITRIVGSLGIYTKIDFENRQVAECHSTSAIFRGYSIFMKGKDPRDSHFITSRICGICGDNHPTCSVYAQNMAYGIKPPPIAEWIINLGEAAEYMFDHNIFRTILLGSISANRWSGRPIPASGTRLRTRQRRTPRIMATARSATL
jgi:hydrogenase large subunit